MPGGARDSHCQGGDIANGNGTWSSRSIFKRGDFRTLNLHFEAHRAPGASRCATAANRIPTGPSS